MRILETIVDKVHGAGWHVVTTKTENNRRNLYHIFDENFKQLFCGEFREAKAFMWGYELGKEKHNEGLGK